jgi:hypothetical protein
MIAPEGASTSMTFVGPINTPFERLPIASLIDCMYNSASASEVKLVFILRYPELTSSEYINLISPPPVFA